MSDVKAIEGTRMGGQLNRILEKANEKRRKAAEARAARKLQFEADLLKKKEEEEKLQQEIAANPNSADAATRRARDRKFLLPSPLRKALPAIELMGFPVDEKMIDIVIWLNKFRLELSQYHAIMIWMALFQFFTFSFESSFASFMLFMLNVVYMISFILTSVLNIDIKILSIFAIPLKEHDSPTSLVKSIAFTVLVCSLHLLIVRISVDYSYFWLLQFFWALNFSIEPSHALLYIQGLQTFVCLHWMWGFDMWVLCGVLCSYSIGQLISLATNKDLYEFIPEIAKRQGLYNFLFQFVGFLATYKWTVVYWESTGTVIVFYCCIVIFWNISIVASTTGRVSIANPLVWILCLLLFAACLQLNLFVWIHTLLSFLWIMSCIPV